jgi:branched-chain amino acid transport system ATP-binding protein
MLEVKGLHSGYGELAVLRGIDISVPTGETVAIIGANGAGKTTFLRTISGLLPATSGSIKLEDRDVANLPAHMLARAGIGHVPEGRKVFKPLNVETNLELGSYSRSGRTAATIRSDIERIYALFPRLHERRKQVAGTLSGGEQQMLAIGRALMGRPRLLLLDEPSLGLAPQIFMEIFRVLAKVRSDGVTIVLVEQNVRLALEQAQKAYVFQGGQVVLSGNGKDVLRSDLVQQAYLGGSLRAPNRASVT